MVVELEDFQQACCQRDHNRELMLVKETDIQRDEQVELSAEFSITNFVK